MRKLLHTLSTFCLIAPLVLSNKLFAEEQTPSPDTSVAENVQIREQVMTFLSATYGPAKNSQWTIKHDGRRYNVSFSYGWRSQGEATEVTFAAISGPALEAYEGRYTPGYLRIFLLKIGAGGLEEIARSKPIVHGEQAQPPEFEGVIKIGSQRHGLIVSITQSWQGLARKDYLIYADDGRAIVKFGAFAIHSSACGNAPSTKNCWTARLFFAADKFDRSASCFPLSVARIEESWQTRKERSRQVTMVGCKRNGRYPTPKGFEGPFF